MISSQQGLLVLNEQVGLQVSYVPLHRLRWQKWLPKLSLVVMDHNMLSISYLWYLPKITIMHSNSRRQSSLSLADILFALQVQ